MRVERARMGFGARIVAGVLAALVLAHPLAATATTAENRYGVAVIIGNKTYKGRTPTVDFAHNDADAMKRFVIERLGYRPGNIIDLRDATLAENRYACPRSRISAATALTAAYGSPSIAELEAHDRGEARFTGHQRDGEGAQG